MNGAGHSAPTFSLPGTDGDQEFERYELSEYTDSGAAILVFYPFDFSPVCTTELCRFRDAEWLTVSDDVDVLGISRDGCYSHARFIDAYSLPFPLLSDVEGAVTRAYDVEYDEWELHSGVPKRAVFLVDDEGSIQYRWVTDDAYENPDLMELGREVASLPRVDLEPESIEVP